MPGLNELMKVVKVITKDDPNLMKGINDFFLKINQSSNQSSQPISENTGINSNNMNRDNLNSSKENADNSDPSKMAEADKAKRIERNRKQDHSVSETIPSTKKSDLINEIFKYELDNDKLIEGIIYTEVFGTPLSKRRGRHGRAR